MSLLCAQGTANPSQRICSLMRERAKNLAILPHVAGEALSLIRRPDADFQKVARLLERDLPLAAEILRLANSPAFGGSRDISRLADAVIRLGLNRCQDLILSSCAANMMRHVTLEQYWIRDVLWRHSYATGICCQILNASLGLRFSGEEFSAGLIHDIGRLLLAVIVPEHFHEGDPMDFNESHDPLAHEQAAFGTDHAELGAWFAEESGLPHAIVDVIRHHHAPDKAVRHRELVALVSIADQMSNHFIAEESPEGFDLAACLTLLPQLREDDVASSEASCQAILTLAWTRVQSSKALSL